jgi:hypothetical protein
MRIIAIFVLLAVSFVLIAGCTQPSGQATSGTPVPTAKPTENVPVTQVTTAPPTDYLTSVQKGNEEVLAGKKSMQQGRDLMLQALARQGNVMTVRPILDQAAANFTEAQKHYRQAGDYYTAAQPTAPSGMQGNLQTMINTLQGTVVSCNAFLASTDLAIRGDWYGANDAFNKAASYYDVSMNTINPILILLGMSS